MRRQRCVWSGEQIGRAGGSGFGPCLHVLVCRRCLFLLCGPGAGSSASSSAAGGDEELRDVLGAQRAACWLPCPAFSSWLHPVRLV